MGILWRNLEFSFDRWALVLECLYQLHNFCIEEREPVPGNLNEDVMPGDISIPLSNMYGLNGQTTSDVSENVVEDNTTQITSAHTAPFTYEFPDFTGRVGANYTLRDAITNRLRLANIRRP